jgi:hypothetical protein
MINISYLAQIRFLGSKSRAEVLCKSDFERMVADIVKAQGSLRPRAAVPFYCSTLPLTAILL